MKIKLIALERLIKKHHFKKLLAFAVSLDETTVNIWGKMHKNLFCIKCFEIFYTLKRAKLECIASILERRASKPPVCGCVSVSEPQSLFSGLCDLYQYHIVVNCLNTLVHFHI